VGWPDLSVCFDGYLLSRFTAAVTVRAEPVPGQNSKSYIFDLRSYFNRLKLCICKEKENIDKNC